MRNRQLPDDVKVWKAIERLLKTSCRKSWNVVSVCWEAKKYCYKTVDGTVDVVDREFLDDRINAGLY